MSFLAQRVVAAHSCERCLSATRGMIEIEIVEFVGFRRRSRDVGVGRPIGRRENCFQRQPRTPIDRPIAPGLDGDLPQILRIKDQQIFARQPISPLASRMAWPRRPSSASPAKNEMPSARASTISSVIWGQHRDRAGDVKAADANGQTGSPKRPGEIDGARKLVRLDADQPDQRPAPGFADRPDDSGRADALIGFIKGMEADADPGAEHLTPGGILGEPVQAGRRIRGYCGLDPADRIAIVVIMGRLDQYEMEDGRIAAPRPGRHHGPCRLLIRIMMGLSHKFE
jgi:hypothetical protein